MCAWCAVRSFRRTARKTPSLSSRCRCGCQSCYLIVLFCGVSCETLFFNDVAVQSIKLLRKIFFCFGVIRSPGQHHRSSVPVEVHLFNIYQSAVSAVSSDKQHIYRRVIQVAAFQMSAILHLCNLFNKKFVKCFVHLDRSFIFVPSNKRSRRTQLTKQQEPITGINKRVIWMQYDRN